MTETKRAEGVEKLFPFVLRARALVVGRQALLAAKRKLHFLLITADLSENSKEEVLRGFREIPILQHYRSEDIQRLFRLANTKVLGFPKSPLSKPIYEGLKGYLIQTPEAAGRAGSGRGVGKPGGGGKVLPRLNKGEGGPVVGGRFGGGR